MHVYNFKIPVLQSGTAALQVSNVQISGAAPGVSGGLNVAGGEAEKGHTAPQPPAAQLPEGEAPEAGMVGKMAASIAGVAGASQVLGWGASGGKKPKADVQGTVPSVEAGADVPSAVEGGVDVPAVEGELTLPSGSVDAGGELFFLCCGCVMVAGTAVYPCAGADGAT